MDKLLAQRLGQLKKTEVSHDASGPKLSGFVEESDVKDYQGRMLDLNIEEWLPLVESETFETEMVPIDEAGAALLVEAHEEWVERCKALRIRLGAGTSAAGAAASGGQGATAAGGVEGVDAGLSDATLRRLREFGRTSGLQACMDRMAGDGGAVFVKTSSRSAKDAPVFSASMRSLMHKFLLANPDPAQRDSINARLLALLQAATDMLKMHSAPEVLETFVRSQRIRDDMRLALDNPERFRENFVVRRWHNIAVDQEYRAFVKDNRMTAISQYNHMLASPRVQKDGHEIMRKCHAFWAENIRDKLRGKLDSYVIDFAVCGRDYGDVQAPQTQEGMRIWVIELNPFETTTDGALFSWGAEGDLLRGELSPAPADAAAEAAALVTRVQDRVQAGVKALVAVDWRVLLETPLAELDPGRVPEFTPPLVSRKWTLPKSGGSSGGGVSDDAAAAAAAATAAAESSTLSPVAAEDSEFTVMQFNTLADSLHDAFPHVPDQSVLKWEFRAPRLLAEIVRTRPDVVCLEEVDTVCFHDFFQPRLSAHGFQGTFASKGGAAAARDGTAVFWREQVFRVMDHEVVSVSAGGVGVICELEHVRTRRTLIVAAVHLKAKPGYEQRRLREGYRLLQRVRARLDAAGRDKAATVVCGDFNDEPNSPVARFFASEEVEHTPSADKGADAGADMTSEEGGGPTPGQKLRHTLDLASAYARYDLRGDDDGNCPGTAEPYTTFKKRDHEVIHCIDYLFFREATTEQAADGTVAGLPLRLTSLLEVPPRPLLADRLPADCYPSDHLAIAAKFSWNV